MSREKGSVPFFIAVATVAGTFALWYVLTATGVISAARFASPREVWAALMQISVQGYPDAKLWQHILQSCKLVLMGFLAAIAVGVPLGLAMGWSKRAFRDLHEGRSASAKIVLHP